MKCANPTCNSTLLYLRGGVLRLLEMETEPARRLQGHGDGFPVCRPSARFFWLCAECARNLVIKRWAAQGLILEWRPMKHAPKPEAVEGSPLTPFSLPAVRTA